MRDFSLLPEFLEFHSLVSGARKELRPKEDKPIIQEVVEIGDFYIPGLAKT